MSKKKIKIRYIIFVLIIIGIVVFVGKITKLDDLNGRRSKNLRVCLMKEKRNLYFQSSTHLAGAKEPL